MRTVIIVLSLLVGAFAAPQFFFGTNSGVFGGRGRSLTLGSPALPDSFLAQLTKSVNQNADAVNSISGGSAKNTEATPEAIPEAPSKAAPDAAQAETVGVKTTQQESAVEVNVKKSVSEVTQEAPEPEIQLENNGPAPESEIEGLIEESAPIDGLVEEEAPAGDLPLLEEPAAEIDETQAEGAIEPKEEVVAEETATEVTDSDVTENPDVVTSEDETTSVPQDETTEPADLSFGDSLLGAASVIQETIVEAPTQTESPVQEEIVPDDLLVQNAELELSVQQAGQLKNVQIEETTTQVPDNTDDTTGEQSSATEIPELETLVESTDSPINLEELDSKPSNVKENEIPDTEGKRGKQLLLVIAKQPRTESEDTLSTDDETPADSVDAENVAPKKESVNDELTESAPIVEESVSIVEQPLPEAESESIVENNAATNEDKVKDATKETEEAPVSEAEDTPVAVNAPTEETADEPIATDDAPSPAIEVIEVHATNGEAEPTVELVEVPVAESVNAEGEEPLEALVEEIAEDPVEEIAEAPVEEIAEGPVEEIAETPVEEIAEVPVEAPVEEIVEAPVEEIVEAPVEEIVETPVEELAEAPVEELAEAPVEELAEAPVEEIAEAQVEEVAEVPVEEIAEVPVVEVVDVPVEEAAEIQIEEVAKSPVVGVAEAPVEEVVESAAPEAAQARNADAAVETLSKLAATQETASNQGQSSAKSISSQPQIQKLTPTFSVMQAPVVRSFGFGASRNAPVAPILHGGAFVDPRALVAPRFRQHIYSNDGPDIVAAKVALFRLHAALNPALAAGRV